jgi:hypothetical protein
MVRVRVRTILTERPPLVGEVIAKVVSLTNPYGRILGCLDRNHYLSIK